MASFCSLGMSMIPSDATAGRKTIRESRNSCDIAVAVYLPFIWVQKSKFSPFPGAAWESVTTHFSRNTQSPRRQRRRPKKRNEQKNGQRPNDDEQHVLANPSGLNRMQA